MSSGAEWTALDRNTYRVKWDKRVWILQATPEAKYPWLLHSKSDDPDYREQAVGSRDIQAAQRQAEMWLSLQYIDDLCVS